MSLDRIPEPTVVKDPTEKKYFNELVRVLRNNITDLYTTVSALAFTAESISYDNTTSGIVADDVQAAIDELYASIIGGFVPDGDKVDIITTSSGAVWTIDNDAVTYAKMQNISVTDRLLGRDTAGAGDIEELTVSGGIEFTGSGGIQRSALTGDVTASAGSNTTAIASGVIVNDDINASAAIDATKIANGTVTSTEFQYIGGLTSDAQTQITSKAAHATTITVAGTANEITSSAGAQDLSANRTWTLSLPAEIDLGGKTSLEIPNSAAPTVNADGEIALDTTVTDFSHGIIKYYGGEEMAVVAMPIAQLTTPINGYVVTYNATNDEFEMAAASAVVSDGDKGEISITGGVWTIDNSVVTYAKMQDVSATDKLLGRSTAGAGVVEEIACTAFGRSILDDADEATFKATVNLEIGTDVQAYDADTTKNDVANTFTANQSITGTTLYPLTLTFADDGATGGPFIYLYRNSASPAANDATGGIDFVANSDTTSRVFSRIYSTSLDVTDASRDGRVAIQTCNAGTLANRVYIAEGFWVGSPTSGDMGVGTVNATDYYNDGVLLPAGCAAQSDQETATSTTLAVTPSIQHNHPSAAKAWVKCGVAADVTLGYNVPSTADGGAGITTVTIGTDFSSADWCCVVGGLGTGTSVTTAKVVSCSSQAAGTVILAAYDLSATPVLEDPTHFFMAGFGDHA